MKHKFLMRKTGKQEGKSNVQFPLHPTLKQFSRNLFWDVDKGDINLEKHSRYIVERVLTRGNLEDWKLLVGYYTLERVVEEAQRIKCLDYESVTFISCVGNVPIKRFRCYKEKLLSPNYWLS